MAKRKYSKKTTKRVLRANAPRVQGARQDAGHGEPRSRRRQALVEVDLPAGRVEATTCGRFDRERPRRELIFATMLFVSEHVLGVPK